MEDVFLPIVICGMLFIGVPWLILHYVSSWKRQGGGITREDEQLLDELAELARRLEDRLTTMERIHAADNPDWKPTHARLSESAQDFDPRFERIRDRFESRRD